MFIISIIRDTIPVHPSNFGISTEQSLTAELNKKYANRVLHDLGLCICVFDLVEVGEGKVRYGDGFLWYKLVFRLVVFRPFSSEVIFARVKSSDRDSIRLSLGFFDDIYIPAIYLPQPSTFDPQERAHFWIAEGEPDTPAETLLTSSADQRMYIDTGEIIRVRVESDEFYDDEPGPPQIHEGVVQPREKKRAPYTIVASIAEQGLGPVAWWKPQEDAMPVEE